MNFLVHPWGAFVGKNSLSCPPGEASIMCHTAYHCRKGEYAVSQRRGKECESKEHGGIRGSFVVTGDGPESLREEEIRSRNWESLLLRAASSGEGTDTSSDCFLFTWRHYLQNCAISSSLLRDYLPGYKVFPAENRCLRKAEQEGAQSVT